MKRTLFGVVSTIFLLLVAACSADVPSLAAPPVTSTDVIESPAVTPSPTLILTPTVTYTLTPQPTLTPTPVIYLVQENDTLTFIAGRYGVTLEELLTANPGFNPDQLAIGDELVLPPSAALPQTQSASSTSDVAVELGETRCVPSAGGGVHCYALAHNISGTILYDLIAEFTLKDAGGIEIITKDVPLSLRGLAAGQSLPFYSYFPPPVEPDFKVAVELVGMSRTKDEKDATIPLEIGELTVLNAESDLVAVVEGTTSHNGNASLELLRLVAVAYDADGEVVGLRVIELEDKLEKKATLAFSIEVYSTGGIIDRVEVTGEGSE